MLRFISKISAVSALCLWGANAQGQNLPSLRYVGVLPVQWQGSAPGVMPAGSTAVIQNAFSQAVRKSGRFQVIGDEVTGDLWSKPEGRLQLEKRYELSALISLSAQPRGDAVLFVARLLSPKLSTYLLESESVLSHWLQTANQKQIYDRMESLVFRLFNRIPIDVMVTSVQGRYVTVSGGESQGLQVGDELSFFRVSIISTHPAHGSWLSYDMKPLGKAKVIEAKKHAAVAEITKQNYDNAIQVDDGAKVPAINSRKKFTRFENELAAASPSSVIVAPEYQGQPVDDPHFKKPPPPEVPAAATEPPSKEKGVAAAASPSEKAKTNEAAQDESEKEEGGVAKETEEEAAAKAEEEEPATFLAAIGRKFGYLKAHAAMKLWSASGAASAAAKMPPWIFNHFHGILGNRINESMIVEYDGFFDFGPTGKGSAFGFGVGSRLIWQANARNVNKKFHNFNFGGLARYDSIGVSGETFGGSDILKLGGFFGVDGEQALGEKTLAWDAELSVIPFAMGKIGSKGGKADIGGTFGYVLAADATLVGNPKTWEWGALFRFGSADYSLKGGSITISALTLGGSARYRF